MKTFKNFRFLLIAGIAAVTLSSCLTDQYNQIQNNSNYKVQRMPKFSSLLLGCHLDFDF